MPHRSWRAFTFGLQVCGDFPAAGLDASPSVPEGAPGTRIELVDLDAVMARWPRRSARTIYELRSAPTEPPILTIDHEERAGYLLRHELFGAYLVGANGSQIAAAPAPLAPWRWQRFLIGQLLPLAAVLQGLEVFHSSAVAIRGQSVLFMGPSGSGKTTLALGLMMTGAGFLADDVVAVSSDGRVVAAHPGARVASLDDQMARTMETTWGRAPGVAIGQEGGESRLLVRRDDVSRPVGLVYLLQRREGGGEPSISALDAPDPRRLLGSTFNSYVDAPERLLGQLSSCAALTRSARFFALGAGDARIGGLVTDVNRHANAVLDSYL